MYKYLHCHKPTVIQTKSNFNQIEQTFSSSNPEQNPTFQLFRNRNTYILRTGFLKVLKKIIWGSIKNLPIVGFLKDTALKS